MLFCELKCRIYNLDVSVGVSCFSYFDREGREISFEEGGVEVK